MAFELVEPAVEALFARLSNPALPLASLIQTFSRAYKLPTDVQAEQQPALFLVTEKVKQINPSGGRTTVEPGHPSTLMVECRVIIYATQEPDAENPEGAVLHPLAEAVEQCLKFRPGLDLPRQWDNVYANLGGLAFRVNVGEETDIVQGTGTSQQGTVLMPIEMYLVGGEP